MIKENFIPTINISSLIKNKFDTKIAIKTINKIEKACINAGFFQVVGHGIDLKEIKKTCNVGYKFFNSSENNKKKLSPKKWNKKNKNLYRGYFPNNVNGKEGLDIGDLRVDKSYSSKTKNQYIEHLNLSRSFNIQSIKILEKYFDSVFSLSESLFKSIIRLYKKNPDISQKAFSRLKTLSTLRFNYYPKQNKPVIKRRWCCFRLRNTC